MFANRPLIPSFNHTHLAFVISTMFVRLFVLFCALALGTLADRHHFCWCNSEQVPDHDLCLTQAACNYYPQDKFFGVHYGDPNAPTISKMNFKKQECYGTRAWPIIPHPFLGGNEFDDACYAAAADPAVVNACGISPGTRTKIKSRCSYGFN